MPPGTGDIALTLSQMLPLTGAVVVCTPQDVALLDAVKAIAMFRKVNIPVLGMVENMSGFVCPDCGKKYDIFGSGGARKRAAELNVPFLGEVPLAPYETPGGQAFADTVVPFLEATNTIILTNHGTVSFGKDLVEAYWKTEILDAYCRILILSKQLGGVQYLNEQKSRELLDLKKRLGFDDPRFHVENCDLCGNSAFRNGYREQEPQVCAFEPPPS